MVAETVTGKDPFDRVDELLGMLAAEQTAILGLLAESTGKHQAIDAEYAPQLNPHYRRAWEAFLELKALFVAHPEMVPKGKRSSRRNTGTLGLREKSEIVMHVDAAEIIRRIKALGQSASRKLVRRVVTWELRNLNVKARENATLIAQVDGLEVLHTDDFYADPAHGFRMSTATPWWPTLEGVTSSKAFRTLFPEDT